MAYTFSVDDVAFLRSAAGAEAVARAEQLALSEASLIGDLQRLRAAVGDRAGATVETARLRRLAIGKLGERAANWLLTADALQQASPWPVAMHRARRMRRFGVHDLTCSIGTDTVALAESGAAPVLGSDLDEVRLAFARHNHPHGTFVRADALTRSSAGLLPYADPARRDGAGRRITSAATIPPIGELDRVWSHRPPVLRVPPGIDYTELDRPGEVEIVSLDGGVREAVLWPAELAEAGVRRRASMLGGGPDEWSVVEAITDADDDGGSATLPRHLDEPDIADFLIEPDGAVIRAHLVRHYAARHGLRLLDPHLAYLTGDVRPEGVRGFRVLDAAPYRDKQVGAWIVGDGVGTLEILQRGTSVIPDQLRMRLRHRLGKDTTRAATLVIARIGSRPWAFWCRAER